MDFYSLVGNYLDCEDTKKYVLTNKQVYLSLHGSEHWERKKVLLRYCSRINKRVPKDLLKKVVWPDNIPAKNIGLGIATQWVGERASLSYKEYDKYKSYFTRDFISDMQLSASILMVHRDKYRTLHVVAYHVLDSYGLMVKDIGGIDDYDERLYIDNGTCQLYQLKSIDVTKCTPEQVVEKVKEIQEYKNYGIHVFYDPST